MEQRGCLLLVQSPLDATSVYATDLDEAKYSSMLLKVEPVVQLWQNTTDIASSVWIFSYSSNLNQWTNRHQPSDDVSDPTTLAPPVPLYDDDEKSHEPW